MVCLIHDGSTGRASLPHGSTWQVGPEARAIAPGQPGIFGQNSAQRVPSGPSKKREAPQNAWPKTKVSKLRSCRLDFLQPKLIRLRPPCGLLPCGNQMHKARKRLIHLLEALQLMNRLRTNTCRQLLSFQNQGTAEATILTCHFDQVP